MKKIYLLIFVFILLLASCARQPLNNVEQALRLAKNKPELIDSQSTDGFFSALEAHIEVAKKSQLVLDPLVFGKVKIAKSVYLNSLEKILMNKDNWKSYITENFDFYEVYGRDDYSEVMVTGYYEPLVTGSLKESLVYTQALYRTPSDLIMIDLKKFAHKFENYPNPPQIIGQIVDNNFLPYFTRKEIDSDKKLQGKDLEILWVKPVDAFFIQIQGSGLIQLENGERQRVGYDGQNGHSYKAIGKALTNYIPMNEMSMQKIKLHLNTLSPNDQQKIFNFNPSYVFFKKLDSLALTYAGMEVFEGRTIATDKEFFPKGAMAFLEVDEPYFSDSNSIIASEWVKKPRVVFDQDTGGAIKGGGRVDLFFGSGEIAQQKAGIMRHPGKLYYLVPKLF